MSRAGVLLAVMFMAVLTAMALGTGQLLLAGLLMAVIVVPMAYAIYLYTFGPRHDMLFWVLAVSVFATSLASALLRQRFSSISTGLVLAFAPMVVIAVLQQAHASKRLMPAILLTLAFYLIAILSSLLGRSGFLSSVYSGIVSLKPFVLLGFGAALFWSSRSERAFAAIVRWAWLPLLVLAALQWFAPSIYAAVLSDPESQPEGNPIVPGFPRAMGPFNHPAILAGIAGCFGLFCFVNFLLQQRGRFVSALTLMMYLVVMAMAGQRQELAGALITLVAAYAIARWRPPFSLLVGVTAIALMLVAIGLYAVIPTTIENELRNWGLADSYGAYSARAILYGDAISLANRYWPLGSGFGTFASVGSIRFDQSLFDEMGYGAFWWFTARSFLQDAFWSKYIAETGWLGFLAHVGVYLLVLRAVLGWLRSEAATSDPELFRRIVCAAVGLVFVIITSPTANALAEVHGALFPLMYVGIAWQQIVAARKATPTPPRP